MQDIHLQEASERFNLDMKLLQAHVQNGLIHGEDCEDGTIDYPETEFHRAAQFCLLEKQGMKQETMKIQPESPVVIIWLQILLRTWFRM